MAAMPGLDGAETMRILGRDETLARLETARELILLRTEEERGEKAGERDEGGDEVVTLPVFKDSPNPPPGYQKAESRRRVEETRKKDEKAKDGTDSDGEQ